MRVIALLLSFSLLAACAGPISGQARRPAGPKPAIGPELTLSLDRRGADARRFVEEVAARCLLDGVVRGAAMVVDRQSGRVVIAGDREELLAIDILGSGWRSTRVRLSGPTVADPRTREAMVYQIDRASRTGDTACPHLAAL